MANPLLRPFLRLSSSLLHRSISFRQILLKHEPAFQQLHRGPCSSHQSWQWRSITHGTVNVLISPKGNPKFETHEIDPPKKEKFKNKKRFKLQKLNEKQKRKAANMRDPRRLGVKGDRKRKFATAEERIKYKLEQVCADFGLSPFIYICSYGVSLSVL